MAVAAAAAAPAACFAHGWPLWAVLAVIGAASQVLERRTKAGVVLSAPLLATLLALLAAAARLIPTAAPAYAAIWAYFLPLGAALYLLECDISE